MKSRDELIAEKRELLRKKSIAGRQGQPQAKLNAKLEKIEGMLASYDIRLIPTWPGKNRIRQVAPEGDAVYEVKAGNLHIK